jgi:uncharacterized protein (DUF427 family)
MQNLPPSTVKAFWNDVLIAESSDTIVVDNNHYFPSSSVKQEYLSQSDHTSICSWKGVASYHHITVNDSTNENAVWCYCSPKGEALKIAGYMAFWKGVTVEA